MPVRIGHLGIVRLSGAELLALRRACYKRDNGKCVVCGIKLRWETGYWDSMEMCHSISRGAGGSDTLDNVRSKCRGHHHAEHCPKAIPKPKVRIM